jgi:hypothetical protein
MEAELRGALEGDAEVGFFEAGFDPATQLRRGRVAANDAYAAAMHGEASGAALRERFARHAAPLPAPELDFLAAALDDLLRVRGSGDAVQYLRIVRPVHGGPAEGAVTALVCVLTRTRFDSGGRVTKVPHRPRSTNLSRPHLHSHFPTTHPILLRLPFSAPPKGISPSSVPIPAEPRPACSPARSLLGS